MADLFHDSLRKERTFETECIFHCESWELVPALCAAKFLRTRTHRPPEQGQQIWQTVRRFPKKRHFEWSTFNFPIQFHSAKCEKICVIQAFVHS